VLFHFEALLCSFFGGVWFLTPYLSVSRLSDMKLKEEIVFDIVKAILDNTFVAPAQETPTTAEVPQTPRSPIRPADDRPVRRRPAAAASSTANSTASSKSKAMVPVADKENVEENDLSSAVATLKFEPIVRTRRGRAAQNM